MVTFHHCCMLENQQRRLSPIFLKDSGLDPSWLTGNRSQIRKVVILRRMPRSYD